MPAGGYKGAGLALIVEIMAAALAGARFGFEASSFADNAGGPPRTGQLLLAIDATTFSADFASRAEALFAEIGKQDGARLPGDKRLQVRASTPTAGVELPDDRYEELKRLAGK
jgi:(2R)-3-sulfolactate dehydrogenase (NADP+)